MQKHLFILDPLTSLNLTLDSSLRMAFALTKAGCEVYACQNEHVSWRSHQPTATTQGALLQFGDQVGELRFAAPQKMALDEFVAIHMRKDPPFDMNYIATTWLLDSVAPKTLIFNAPQALRGLNEKLATLLFPEETSDAIVSSDPEILLEFIESRCHGDAVLKPLNLYGGRGVQRLKLNSSPLERRQLLTQLRQETDNGKSMRLIQPFNSKIFDGEVRCFAFAGTPLAWCLKRPAPGNFLANTAAGATLEPYQPSSQEKQRVEKVAQHLLKRGVYVVGFDVIGGLISEINITSPRLLVGKGDDSQYYDDFARRVLDVVKKHPIA